MSRYTLSGSKITGVRKAMSDFNSGEVGVVIGMYGGYSGSSPDFDTHFEVFSSEKEYKIAELNHINGTQPLVEWNIVKKTKEQKITMEELYDVVEERFGFK